MSNSNIASENTTNNHLSLNCLQGRICLKKAIHSSLTTLWNPCHCPWRSFYRLPKVPEYTNNCLTMCKAAGSHQAFSDTACGSRVDPGSVCVIEMTLTESFHSWLHSLPNTDAHAFTQTGSVPKPSVQSRFVSHFGFTILLSSSQCPWLFWKGHMRC